MVYDPVPIDVSGAVVNVHETAGTSRVLLRHDRLHSERETCGPSRLWVTIEPPDSSPTYRFRCDARSLGPNAVLLLLSDPVPDDDRNKLRPQDVGTGTVTVTLITRDQTQVVTVQGVAFVDEAEPA